MASYHESPRTSKKLRARRDDSRQKGSHFVTRVHYKADRYRQRTRWALRAALLVASCGFAGVIITAVLNSRVSALVVALATLLICIGTPRRTIENDSITTTAYAPPPNASLRRFA